MNRPSGWRGQNKGLSCEFAQSACLHRLIIEVEQQEEKTVNGIILADETLNREKQAYMYAKVLAIGADAWLDKTSDAADVGDRIIIARYTGTRLQDVGNREIRFVSDLDILGVALAKV
jgi:co-chaperonin GroES (HSP10)